MALTFATVVALYLCTLFVLPFMPAVVLAVTAAVVTHRFSSWVGGRTRSPDVKAAICTGVVALAFLAPAAFVVYMGVGQVSAAMAEVQSEETAAKIQGWLDQHPRIKQLWGEASKDFDFAAQGPQLVDRLRAGAMTALSLPLYVGMQTLIMLFILYFLYRDESAALESVREVLPLSELEANRFFRRIDDTIHATIYGTVTVALIQGAMGGLIFALLGIPAAVLWGVVMGLLAIIPYLGTFVVWGPTAAFLAMQGDWGRAAVLVGWGALAIGLIDNLLYPMLVGKRLRQHTVVSFIAILGGVSVFGVMGVVLGPVVVSTTFFLFETWRRRTEHGRSAERV